MPNRYNSHLPSNRTLQRDSLYGSAFDRFAREFFAPLVEEDDDRFDRSFWGEQGVFAPKVEVRERGENIEVCAELPGLSEKDIELSLEDNCILIEGEKRNEFREENEGRVRSEFSYGRFSRRIPIQDDVDNENIEAKFRDGILTVTLHRKNDGVENKRRIPIN